MASKVVPIRIPADILERIDTRCMMRKVTRTDVILGALQESFAAKVEPEIPRNTSVAQMSRAVLNIPGVFLGSQLGMNPGPFLTEKADYPGRLEPAHRMCAYSEWSGDLGCTVRCGLPEHGPKVRHGAWIKE